MKRYEVLLTDEAERDLGGILDYITDQDSLAAAYRTLDRIEKTLDSLSALPERGSFPKELIALGIRDYRQIFFKPYWLLYRIMATRVYVYLIVDGRREMQTLLSMRLLEF
jgi:toxin ParE1/3/4